VQRNQGKDGEEAGKESSKKDAELAKTRDFSLLNEGNVDKFCQ